MRIYVPRGDRSPARFGALVLALTFSVSAASIDAALAQQNQQTAQRSFSIPAGSLSSALVAFGQQAGVQVSYVPSVATGLKSPGVSGSMSADAALAQLLSGTGLSFKKSGAKTVVVSIEGAGAGATVEGAITLDTIEVSGTKNAAEAAADTPYQTAGSNANISAEEIGRIPPSSVGDIFKSTPGVISAGNRNGNTLELNIRGLQGMNRVATLIDGTQQTSSYYRGYSGNQSRTSVDPELLGGVNIEKGPTSGPYGAGSMGGVVNLRTLEVDDILKPGQDVGVRIRGSIGSNNVTDPVAGTTVTRFGGPDDTLSFDKAIASGTVAASTEHIDFIVAAATRRSGNYFAGSEGPTTGLIRSGSRIVTGPLSLFGAGEEVFNTWEDTQSQLAKGTLRFAEGMSLELGYVRYRSEFGEYDDLALQFASFFGRMELPPTSRDVDTYTAKYKWQPADNPLIELHANVWASQVDDEINYFTGGSTINNDVLTKGVELWNTSRVDAAFGAFEIMYGLQYSDEDAKSTSGTNPNGFRTLGSAFTQAAWQVNDWLKLDAGLRYERFEGGGVNATDRSADRTNPTASVTVSPFDGIQLFAKYAEGWRPPSVREMTALTPNTVINPGLDPELAKNWEFGLNTLRENLLDEGDKVRFKAVYFDNTYDDYIIRLNRPRRPGESSSSYAASPYWWDNIDKAIYKGLEFSASYDAGWIFTQGAYTHYTDIQYCMPNCVETTGNNDFGANYVPPEYSGSITLGFRAFHEALTFGGRMDFVGRQTIASNIAGTTVAAEWEPSKIYGLFASYDMNENVKFNASAENLLDTYYLDAMSSTKLPAPGRTVRAGITLTY